MQPWKYTLRLVLALILLAVSSDRAWGTTGKKTEHRRARHELSWWEHYRPKEATPQGQLALVNKLKDEGHNIKASKASLALVSTWPESPQAPVAQLIYCRLLEERGKLAKAFKEYQFLVEAYTGFFPYEEVMERMYAIADTIARSDQSFLFIKFRTPEKAIPMFEQLIRNGTQWKRSSEMQYRIAQIHDNSRQYELAIEAYGIYHQRYPVSPLAEQALFSQGRCCYLYSLNHPVAMELRENAVAVLQGFLDWYPYSDKAAEARTYLNELQQDLASGLYDQAVFYDRSARFFYNKRKHDVILAAALVCYERVIDEFPHSRWAEQAHARVTKLKKNR